MKNFACWRADDAYTIINPDADAVPDHVFRAVHTDVPIHIRDRSNGPATVERLEELLSRFLAPRDHVLVPVIGQSGTGKSHLIRWLRVRLPATADREVIFVPKAQTNLRDIIRTLADRLPEIERVQILTELQGAGGSLNSAEAKRTAILNELHTALQNDGGDPQSGIEAELEHYLLEGLRAVFNDHHLRGNHFLHDGGFAADLAAHVFDRPDRYRPAEKRRTFGVADLPLEIGGIKRSGLSAQDFLSFLVGADDSIKEAAVSIVNRHVDRAIARCLNITGDRLIELMLGIRRRMRSEGKSLVMLIEDFARLQGLDRALLQSLIEQRHDLCVLRTAFACTTGFYGTIAETVMTRLTFIVDMDVPLGADGGGGFDLARLTGRYMNALRIGEAGLKEAFEAFEAFEAYAGGEEDFAVPSCCDPCAHRAVCHSAFGEVDGFGLYPFTRHALEILADRADPKARERFNTRAFQKSVLRPVALAAPAIETGRFPDANLLDSLGGVQGFPPAEQRKLEIADPGQWRRRLTLLQLWDGGTRATNLRDDLQMAFGLGRIDVGDTEPPLPPPEPGTKPPERPGPHSDLRQQELADWYNEQSLLSQRVANDLRPFLFKAIDETIDWDSIGYAQADFRGVSRAFQQGSIFFDRQTTGRPTNLVVLTIPSDWSRREERSQTVMALQGLLEANTAGGWAFPGGAEKFACLLECLARWSEEVVRQLRELDDASAGWDPAAAAFALRVSMALLTNPSASTSSNLSIIRAGLGPIGPITDFAHTGLRSLVNEVLKYDDDLLGIVMSRRLAMKGGQKGEFVNSHTFLKTAAGLRKSGYVPDALPTGLAPKPRALQQLARLADRVSSAIRPALQGEAELRRNWVAEIDTMLGSDIRQADIVNEVTELINEIGRLGLSDAELATLGSAKTSFQRSQYDAAMSASRKLPEAGNERPTDLAYPVEIAMEVSRGLAKALDTTIRRTEPQLTARFRLAGIDPDAQRTIIAEVDAALSDIEHSLAENHRANAA